MSARKRARKPTEERKAIVTRQRTGKRYAVMTSDTLSYLFSFLTLGDVMQNVSSVCHWFHDVSISSMMRKYICKHLAVCFERKPVSKWGGLATFWKQLYPVQQWSVQKLTIGPLHHLTVAWLVDFYLFLSNECQSRPAHIHISTDETRRDHDTVLELLLFIMSRFKSIQWTIDPHIFMWRGHTREYLSANLVTPEIRPPDAEFQVNFGAAADKVRYSVVLEPATYQFFDSIWYRPLSLIKSHLQESGIRTGKSVLFASQLD